MKISSYQLIEFNLDGHIDYDGKCGLIKIMRDDNGHLILAEDYDYNLIDSKNPTPSRILSRDPVIGFVLDIGIRREKQLTHGEGFYFPIKLIPQVQSAKKISQKDFDSALFEKIDTTINGQYQSGEPAKELNAIRINHLLNAYNDARLLFPNFYSDSYLGLMRILDALSKARGGYSFATWVASISPALNQEIYGKLFAVQPFAPRLKNAEALFNACLTKAPQQCKPTMNGLDIYGKTTFSCFYGAYQYRSKFVHQGFPFPDIVKQSLGLETDSGTAYLHPALGNSHIKIFRPEGLQDGDIIDMHNVITDSDTDEIKRFQDNTYFQLMPTWHYLKRMVRAALIKEISP